MDSDNTVSVDLTKTYTLTVTEDLGTGAGTVSAEPDYLTNQVGASPLTYKVGCVVTLDRKSVV